MKDCASCDWGRKVWTMKYGQDNYCLHPRCHDVYDGVPAFTRRAREVGQPCGPSGDLHSSNDVRMGHIPIAAWRHDQ